MSVEFDPEDWTTWPVPDHGVNSRHPDGRVKRLSEWGDGWVDGFERGMAVQDDWRAIADELARVYRWVCTHHPDIPIEHLPLIRYDECVRSDGKP